MSRAKLDLFITVGGGPDADEEDVERLTYLLSDELRELDVVDTVELLREDAPEGARGSGAITGDLLLELVGSAGISVLISTIGSWLSRDKSRKLKLCLGDKSIELSGLSEDEQQELTQWFKTQAGFSLQG